MKIFGKFSFLFFVLICFSCSTDVSDKKTESSSSGSPEDVTGIESNSDELITSFDS